MPCTNMNDPSHKISEFEDKILDIVKHADEFTQSDLQGAVSAQVMNIMSEGATYGRESIIERIGPGSYELLGDKTTWGDTDYLYDAVITGRNSLRDEILQYHNEQLRGQRK